jgi:hypothetical protein
MRLKSYSLATVGIRDLGKIINDPCRTANAQGNTRARQFSHKNAVCLQLRRKRRKKEREKKNKTV